MRERIVAVAGVVLLVAFAGCSALTGGPVTFGADKATVSEQALSQTGYEEQSVNESVITRNVSAADQSKTVKVTNWIAQYDRSIDLGPLGSQRAAVFSTVATPQVNVLGQSFNPIGDYPREQLVMMLQSRYESIENVQPVGNYSTTMLGQNTTVGKFSADAQLVGGGSVDVYVHVTRVQHGDDYVLAIAVYPQRLDDSESEHVRTLLDAVEHATESE
ncbi:DUF6517 family protein [Halarchaeum nitratireducens]|uniref:Lipoprotein n=1 Tax=Halarchaeum nitratireducens TaxID=489913 RepID=A0A830GCW7_9EURY|nr:MULTISPECIES: DUF6517 family protein [Halarchaeum]MBP2250903.1 hypothetical protein [Halarchaeum solikamskense]GGN19791.1 hypothetical protein GCM10009021_21110 [Halarchaeum nitratireducens]